MNPLTPVQTDALQALAQDTGFRMLHAIYDKNGADLRLVGGCVRDALQGITAGDKDLATDAVPEQGMAWLRAAHIAVKPTGIKHGTITAIIDHMPYEITTLRRDVKTDGRHAEVMFGTSWDADAQRRDFTINGLSCDSGAQLYDPVGGVADIQNGHVRFIGDAATRCQEDYVRILRLFRFWARFGKQPIDRATLLAVSQNADGLTQLSPQRVWMELKKLLAGPRAHQAVAQMQDADILFTLFGGQFHKPDQLNSLYAVEEAVSLPPGSQTDRAVRHLAVLFAYRTQQGWTIDWSALHSHFSLSNREADHLRLIDRMGRAGVWWTGHLLAALAAFGRPAVVDMCFISVALGHDTLAELKDTLPDLLTVAIPVFPVTAGDLLARGFQPGPALGQRLAKIRDYWLDTNCQATQTECLELVQDDTF